MDDFECDFIELDDVESLERDQLAQDDAEQEANIRETERSLWYL